LFSDPMVSTPSRQEQLSERLGTIFSQPCQGRVLLALGRLLLPSLYSSGTHSTSGDHQQGLTSDLLSSKVSALGGALWRAWLRPSTQLVLAGQCTAPRGVHHATCTVNSLACIYSTTYSVINYYCSNCCPYCSSTTVPFVLNDVRLFSSVKWMRVREYDIIQEAL
jgi:hypothetical protein